MAVKRYPVADARRRFADLIGSAERGGVVEITRRGKPVAVLVSAARYASMSGEGRRFVDAANEVRERFRVDALAIDDGIFSGLRDRSPGRTVAL
jgi:prevent-host-death family protein